jgi:hypothetical protein
MQTLEVVAVRIQRLSDSHVNATVTWGARFERTGDRLVTFDITYLLEDVGEGIRILSYVSHTDQEDEMRRLGLLPD